MARRSRRTPPSSPGLRCARPAASRRRRSWSAHRPSVTRPRRQLEAQANPRREGGRGARAEKLAAAEAKVKATHEETLRAEAAKLAAEEADAMALLEKQKKEGGVTAPAGAPPLAVTVSKGGSESGSAASTPRGAPPGRRPRPAPRRRWRSAAPTAPVAGRSGGRRRRAAASRTRRAERLDRRRDDRRLLAFRPSAIKKTASVVGRPPRVGADVWLSDRAAVATRRLARRARAAENDVEQTPLPPSGAMGAPRGPLEPGARRRARVGGRGRARESDLRDPRTAAPTGRPSSSRSPTSRCAATWTR